MFSEYRILREVSRFGLETAIVSGLSLGRRTLSFNFGRLAGGSIDDGPRDGDGFAWRAPDVGVAVVAFPPPELIPLSVANLYFRILALDIREVK